MNTPTQPTIEEMKKIAAETRERCAAIEAAHMLKFRAKCVQKADLIDGATYEGHCRNAHIAVWHADKQKFTYMRRKFGYIDPEDINHFEDEVGHWDVFYPVKQIEGEPT